jgi:hypothetical protein
MQAGDFPEALGPGGWGTSRFHGSGQRWRSCVNWRHDFTFLVWSGCCIRQMTSIRPTGSIRCASAIAKPSVRTQP